MSNKGVALVTGAGQGIGKCIALRLADDGYDVAVNDIPSNEENLRAVSTEINVKGVGKSSIHVADVSKEAEVEKMIKDVVDVHGGLDVMVANAGVVHWQAMFETSVEDFDRIFAVNVRGTFLCYKHAGKQMVAQGRGGRIIGASSVLGKRGSANTIAYSGSKAAIRGMTQSAASELAPHKITVNAYAPGAIETAMLDYVESAFTEGTGAKEGDYMRNLKQRVPLGYNGTPTEIASLVSYIASKEAHFITGQTISCNGGMFMD